MIPAVRTTASRGFEYLGRFMGFLLVACSTNIRIQNLSKRTSITQILLPKLES
jgi:hypothetical protein